MVVEVLGADHVGDSVAANCTVVFTLRIGSGTCVDGDTVDCTPGATLSTEQLSVF